MKQTIILLFSLCYVLSATAQTRNVSALPIDWNDTTVFVPKQTDFYLGHHWMNLTRKTMNKLLHINHYHGAWGIPDIRSSLLNNIPNDGSIKAVVWEFDAKNEMNQAIMAFEHDPSALLQEVPAWGTASKVPPKSRQGDTTGAVFGFAYRDTVHGSVPALGDNNFDRYELTKDSIPPGGVVVLNSPYTQHHFRYNPAFWGTITARKSATVNDLYPNVTFNGAQWYLSVNLRRTDTTDTLMNGDAVLKLRIPYSIQSNPNVSIGPIKFDSIAVTSMSTDTLPFGRGIALKLDTIPSGANSTEFIITRAMLPRGDAANPDITISAFFRLQTATPDSTIPNPELQHNGKKELVNVDADHIIRLGLDVRYFGVSNIAIDWFRFETPYARAVLRSYYDTCYIGYHIYKDIDTMRTYHSRGLRLLSFYGLDDVGESIQYWLGQQHINRLLSGRFINYFYGYAPAREIIKPSYTWVSELAAAGASPSGISPVMPYAFGFNTINYLGYFSGWEPHNYFDTTVVYDSLTGSTYEVVINGKSTVVKNESLYIDKFGALPSSSSHSFITNHHFNNLALWKGWFSYPEYLYIGSNSGPLPIFETYLWTRYGVDSMYYSGTPWWANIWIGSIWKSGKSGNMPYAFTEHIRPQTGEETRFQIWSTLIHGCKGLMFERLYHQPASSALSSITIADSSERPLLGAMNTLDSNITDSYLDSLGERMFDSTMALTGGDFITTGDPTHLDQYINADTVRTWIGINPSRLYIGRLSTRHEVKRICDLIGGTNGIGADLMKLQLKSWYGKGYEELRIGDTTLFKKYVSLDTTLLRSRSFSCTNYEAADSSFLDVTLLRDTTISTDSGFTIGVQNRRTAPFVWLSDTNALAINRPDTVRHSSHPGKVLTFLTTMEFENYVKLGILDKYSQSGAREIKIPFNYHSTHGYALLRIRELGGGIDTVIGQDRSLAVKFLPGEGKMFKVEILHPDTTLAGNLSYTNQRKLVGYPKLGNSDTMFYHLTYHKQIPGLSRSAVYYRRSKAITTNSSTQNIIWENEIPVSVNIRAVKGDTATLVNPNCAYPSLVVRYDDSTQVNKVYIVYACVDDDTCFYSTKKRIVESVLRADDNTQTFTTPLMAETLSKFHGSLDEYGTPMINASDSGNYYCWADSLLGIVAGWKRTDAQYLQDSKSISYNLTIDQLPVDCKHPSLNSYSRIALKEKDCALVWQEKCYSGDNVTRSRILYTRLQMINGILNFYLSPTLSPANGVQIFGPSGYIAELNYGGSQYANHHIPSVYREISDNVVYSEDQQRDTRFDCVSWHSYEFTSNPGTPLGAIYRRVLSIYDTNGVANLWGSDGISRIRASSTYLGNVSLSQGDAELVPVGGYMHNFSARSHIMTFTESPVYTFGGSPPYRKLWQIQSNSYFAPSFHDTSLSAFQSTSKAFVIDNDGAVGQTAALPRMNTQEEWRKNRRVYEGVTDGSLRRIQASAEYFLKQTASSDIEPSIFSGFHDGESTYMLSNPILNGQMLSLERVKRLRGEAGKFGGRHGFTDTLETNWFTVGDEANLMLKSIGKNADLVSAFVERRSDGERFTVQLRTSDDTTALWTRIPLLRGGVEEYRFFMVKNSVGRREEAFTIPDYGEEMVLGAMKTSIGFNKGNNDIQAIDLGRKAGAQASIRVFPNPAQDKVSVVVLGNNPKDVWHIKVMNVLGDVMSEHDDKTSSLLEIVTEDYPSGVYYITAESGKLNATARFVIMK
jgi:hypothetical protein